MAQSNGLVDQFVESCIGTLPDFAAIEATFEGSDFEAGGEGFWTRSADGASFRIEDAGDRLVCMLFQIGDHTKELSEGLEAVLAENELGSYEAKQYQGRSLYLLQTAKGVTILEVIPPQGASTILAANIRKVE